MPRTEGSCLRPLRQKKQLPVPEGGLGESLKYTMFAYKVSIRYSIPICNVSIRYSFTSCGRSPESCTLSQNSAGFDTEVDR